MRDDPVRAQWFMESSGGTSLTFRLDSTRRKLLLLLLLLLKAMMQ